MKHSLSLMLFAALLATACKKDNSSNPTDQPVIFLSKITDNTSADYYKGQPLAEFTYNGKQLSKATIYGYAGYTNNNSPYDVETHLFNYDGQGHLTGVTISHKIPNSYNDVSCTVSYSGDNISELKFYTSGNILDKVIKVTYNAGKLINWFNSNEVNNTYSYDGSGNNTKEVAEEYINGHATGHSYTTINSTFDNKKNLSQSLPIWIYFRAYHQDQFFTYATGKNNPVSVNDDGTAFTYNYQYNDYGYPSTISFQDSSPDLQSYSYQYIKVN